MCRTRRSDSTVYPHLSGIWPRNVSGLIKQAQILSQGFTTSLQITKLQQERQAWRFTPGNLNMGLLEGQGRPKIQTRYGKRSVKFTNVDKSQQCTRKQLRSLLANPDLCPIFPFDYRPTYKVLGVRHRPSALLKDLLYPSAPLNPLSHCSASI